MTKYELSQAIAKKLNMKTTEVITMVEAMMKTMEKTICEGENIYLRGFGTFHIVTRKKKPARVITRNEQIILPARSIIKFKPAKEFKKKLAKSVPVKE